jgi:hypothetical protein
MKEQCAAWFMFSFAQQPISATHNRFSQLEVVEVSPVDRRQFRMRDINEDECILSLAQRIQRNQKRLTVFQVRQMAKRRQWNVLTRILGIGVGAFLGVAAVTSANGEKPTKFALRIENITQPDAFTASNGSKWSLAFSPGTAVVHTDRAPIFSEGKKDRGKGLEAQSEDGSPSMLAKSLKGIKGVRSVAVFNTPIGAAGPGPITPGAAYETVISGMPGDRLSVTLMMGQSNDWFYAPNESGIELFKNGQAINGDITAQLTMWDAGTEVDQEPGIGSEQGPRQKAPNTGKRENGVVRKIQDGKPYSNPSNVLRVTITPAMPPM